MTCAQLVSQIAAAAVICLLASSTQAVAQSRALQLSPWTDAGHGVLLSASPQPEPPGRMRSVAVVVTHVASS